MEQTDPIDIDRPRWDQSSYLGRVKHFFSVTDPLTVFASNAKLDRSKATVEAVRRNDPSVASLSRSEIWEAKKLYASAFHPETGEKLLLFGRMSFQVPGNMVLMGCMLTFYRSLPAVAFWQIANQTFNATVNYTNRNASAPTSFETLGKSYLMACGGAVATAMGMNKLIALSPSLQAGVMGRWASGFMALAAANYINISMMRSAESENGIVVHSRNGEDLGNSQIAAKSAIRQVIFSRICMAVPATLIPAIIMNKLEKKPFLLARPALRSPIMVALVGINLAMSTPLCCALFPQESSLEISSLETSIQEKAKSMNITGSAYFNKGL